MDRSHRRRNPFAVPPLTLSPTQALSQALTLISTLALPLLGPAWALAAPTATEPPTTATEPVTDTYHGVNVVDPYRWLEGSDAPEVAGPDSALDARVAAWTEAQNGYTRTVLDNLPARRRLEERLRSLLEVGKTAAPVERGGRYFYLERRGDQAQPALFVRQGHDGEPRVLLDPNRVDAAGLTAIDWLEPDPQGELVAFGLYSGGDENATLYVLRVATGEWLAEEIPGKVEGVDWLPDSSGFVYRRLRDVEDPYSGQIKVHRLGLHHRQDPLLFEQYREGPLATTWGPFATLDDAGRWLTLVYYTGTESTDLWVYDFAHWQETGELERRDVVVGERALSLGAVVGDTLLLLTTLDAPNGRLVAVDLEHPDRDRWRELVPERRDAVIENVERAKGLLVVRYLERAATRLALFDLEGTPRGELALPGIGDAEVAAEPDSVEAFVTFESFDEPETVYRVDLTSGERQVWARPDLPVEPETIAVEQVSYPSKDGTAVTMFLVYREGLVRDGKAPTILSGYGGFSVPSTPRFRAWLYPWLESGGVFAVANLRGGNEYGEAWHRAGMLEQKQNVFDDFIAAAEWLIANRYTDAAHLGVFGGSNGGLLTGAVLVQRPELFSAVISAVPLLDMLRFQHFLMARFWVPEYGSSEDPDQLRYLLAYSPYHQVEEGVKYPATLLTAGENDSRVHPAHARKMAARLQAATASDLQKEPILLWVEGDAGHGRGMPLATQLREAADQLGFMGWQLGLDWAAEPAAAAP